MGRILTLSLAIFRRATLAVAVNEWECSPALPDSLQ